MDRRDDRNDIHEVWKGSQWHYWHHTQTKHTGDLGPESSHLQCSSQRHISDMTSDDEHQHLHMEEMTARMTADATDRSKIRHKLQESIDPLDACTHSMAILSRL